VTGAALVRPHALTREDPRRLAVGLIGAEAVLRLFHEQERNERVFTALTRFLDLLDEADVGARPELDPLGLAFQLKLLWLAGYQPHTESCAECGAKAALVGFSPRAGGAVCRNCAADAMAMSPAGLAAIETLIRRPLAEAVAADLTDRAAREALSVVATSYEYHGGFRLRTLSV
jgi:DNA repair protein RecO